MRCARLRLVALFLSVASVQGNTTIGYNPALESLAGLDSVASIGRSLLVEENGLRELRGLDALESVGGDMYLESEPGLTSLSGLDRLASIGANGRIEGLDNLMTMDGLGSLTRVGYLLLVVNNPKLPECLVQDYFAQLADGNSYSYGNDDATVCP